MSIFIFPFGNGDLATEELLPSQPKYLYVLEPVAKINLSDDSALPSNLETCFRRLNSLPVSSSKKLLTDSKSFESFSNMKNRKNGSSGSASSRFSRNLSEKSRPFNSSIEKTWGTNRTPTVKSQSQLGESSDSRRIGSSSSRFSRSGHKDLSVSGRIYSNWSRFSQKVETFSSSSFTTNGSTSKSKLKVLTSWFDKLSQARAMGCLPHSSDIKGQELREKREKQRVIREANKDIKKIKRLHSDL